MSSSAVSPARPAPLAAPLGSRRHGAGFWLIAFAFLTAMAFSTVPTPLYPLYMARDGFSTFMVTVVFAVYALGVVISLVLAGHVSDWVGRRRVLVPALLLELVAAVLFVVSTDLTVLLLARLVTGLGVGMITATATAHLAELHAAHRPTASAQRFETVSTAANIGGLGLGPLVAGFLAQWVDAPLRTPYLVFVVLLLLAVAAVLKAPETVTRPEIAPTYRPQRVSADHGDPAGYVTAAAAAFVGFSVFGLFTSVAPGFVAGTLHHPSRALAGLIVFVVFGAAAAAQVLTARLTARAKLNVGLLFEVTGLVATVAGTRTENLALFVVGGVLAGIGAGVLFKAAIGTVVAMAAPARRGEALAGLFLIGYLGLIGPVLGMGLGVRNWPTATVLTWFAAILVLLLAGVAVLDRRAARRA
ncbi:putative multi-drug efflux transporter [Kineosporia sp. NBRC 101677]|uniref:MFS transporter n=1 Tax=Kineosporia sp. NBRC 101677 TaxID=3032197 RepID=UPI0024A37B91|nr:MFS transporter [Kineosporia sp. NBRC 101677]GLY14544.1 putative multi-drug efflux transporter [Kineosporia sp. NBRC 101677]